MKPEYIILIMNLYHPWNTMESEYTEICVIPNDNFTDLNARNLIRMFMQDVLELDILPDYVSNKLSKYTITNDEVDIPITMPNGEWIATITSKYTDIEYYNQTTNQHEH